MIYTHKDARLDRFYITDFMVGQVLKTKVLPEIADHKMVIIDIDMEDLKLWGPFYWKMNNHYLVDKFYKNDIENLIIQFEQRKSYMNILDNWEIFKTKVKNISKSFSTLRSNERKTILKLCDEIKGYDPDPITLKNIEEKEQEIKNFKSKGNLIRSKNEALNKIYKEGKEISRKEEIKNGNVKLIHQLRKENDSMVKEKSEIIDEIYNFYQNLFKSQSIDNEKIDDYLSNFKPPNLTKEDQEAMDRFISEEEVKEAIKNLNINKSPGDDGITPEFYQIFSHTLAPILAEVYNNIWLRDEMTISMRNGIIQLIYKKKGTPTELKFWRPITLLNLDYKILTKILAGRLKCAMDCLLNPNQSSGVKERDILDNILNLKNLIEYTKAKNLQAAFISLDNEKAFYRIEINYMLKVLEKYKFPEYYLRWIKIIYNDITSQVMVNG